MTVLPVLIMLTKENFIYYGERCFNSTPESRSHISNVTLTASSNEIGFAIINTRFFFLRLRVASLHYVAAMTTSLVDSFHSNYEDKTKFKITAKSLRDTNLHKS